jgi:putative hydrolase of the HAD superfamily
MNTEIRAVVFDLDDTLYFEEAYVSSGFRAVAHFLEKSEGIAQELIFNFCWSEHSERVRGTIFDRLREKFGVRLAVPQIVDVYREHIPNIHLEAQALEVLDSLRVKGFMLAVITDGALVTQEAKVRALDLTSKADLVICTDKYGKAYWKPHPRAFEEVMNAFELPGNACVYIGDNPSKDFVAPRALGWLTVRYLDPRQLRFDLVAENAQAQPHCIVSSLRDLEPLLSKVVSGDGN